VNKIPRIVLYGASGHANAVRSHFEHSGVAEIIAFIDDFQGGQGLSLSGRPIITFEEWQVRFLKHPCFIAVGDPKAKRRLAGKVYDAGGQFCRFHDLPDRSFPEVTVGEGSHVQSPGYVGPNTRIGDHVAVMAMTTVGHDVEIGDCCTICPSCAIAGYVKIEDEVFLGTGSTVINGRADRPIVIGRGATVGVGAVVTKSVPAGSSVMGNPARPLRDLSRRGRRHSPA